MTTAEVVWKCLVLHIALLVVLAGVVDVRLIQLGLPTVSDYLRQNPGWLFGPAFILAVTVGVLGWHIMW